MNSMQVLLSDTHFGVRNNSLTWLESQKDFIYNQFIPFLKDLDRKATVIHLGDVFDSRSSISPMICKETNLMLEAIAENCDTFIIIAGNHDYFSPIEGKDNSTSLEMLPCLWKNNNIEILYKDYKILGENAFVPWFDFHNLDKLNKVLEWNPKNIFTHTDLAHLDEETLDLLKGKNIFTGHIHIPLIRASRGWFTLGSCYSINFQDANSDRGFFYMRDWDSSSLEFVPNEKSLRFWRITNEEVLSFEVEDPRDYVELTISDNLYAREDIQDAIKELNSKCTLSVVVVQEDVVFDVIETDSSIYSIVKDKCPEKLHNKLDSIVS